MLSRKKSDINDIRSDIRKFLCRWLYPLVEPYIPESDIRTSNTGKVLYKNSFRVGLKFEINFIVILMFLCHFSDLTLIYSPIIHDIRINSYVTWCHFFEFYPLFKPYLLNSYVTYCIYVPLHLSSLKPKKLKKIF